MQGNTHIKHMQRALELAKQAEALGEVPVGAVITYKNEIIAEGYNQPISSNDPTAHAEIVALRNAAKHVQNYRLLETTLYVTLEPCTMCVGAIIHARIAKLFYAAKEPKAGAIESQSALLDLHQYNHQIEYEGGLLADESKKLLQAFFQKRRK